MKVLYISLNNEKQVIKYAKETAWSSIESLISKLFDINCDDMILVDEDDVPIAISSDLPNEYNLIIKDKNAFKASNKKRILNTTTNKKTKKNKSNKKLKIEKKQSEQVANKDRQNVIDNDVISLKNKESGDKVLQNDSSSVSNWYPSTSLLNESEWKIIKELQDDHGPGVRWGHTMTKLNDNNILIMGGDGPGNGTYKDLWIYNTKTRQFNFQIVNAPEERAWHTATLLEDNSVFVFGGEYSIDDAPELISSPMLLDTTVMLWYPPQTSGLTPRPRSGHQTVLVDKNLYIIGGTLGRKWTNEVLCLNTDLWQWTRPKCLGSLPPPSSYHSAVYVEDQRIIIVFGGNDDRLAFNDIYVLYVDELRWDKPIVMGKKPNARAGHIAIMISSTEMLIHGGWDPQSDQGSSPFDDAFILDTKSWVWSKPTWNTQGLSGVVGHGCVMTSNGLHLFGGGINGDLTNQLSELIFST